MVLPLPGTRASLRGLLVPNSGPDVQRSDFGASSSLRVLVVEDNPVNQRVASQMLRRLGVECVVVGDGDEAVSQVALVPFDAILMDCHLQRMDGWQATEAIRRSEVDQMPIIGVTAGVLPEEVSRCLESGMNEVLPKPFTLTQLREVLQRWAVRRTGAVDVPFEASIAPP